LEWSFVSVPALPSATVTLRKFRPTQTCDLSTLEGRRAHARQRQTWLADLLAEDRRERAERLEARLQRQGYIE
jgi:hypothetical protein